MAGPQLHKCQCKSNKRPRTLFSLPDYLIPDILDRVKNLSRRQKKMIKGHETLKIVIRNNTNATKALEKTVNNLGTVTASLRDLSSLSGVLRTHLRDQALARTGLQGGTTPLDVPEARGGEYMIY